MKHLIIGVIVLTMVGCTEDQLKDEIHEEVKQEKTEDMGSKQLEIPEGFEVDQIDIGTVTSQDGDFIWVGNITITDVRDVLGEDTNKLSELCKSDNINKWALFQPKEWDWGASNVLDGDYIRKNPDTFSLGDFAGYIHDSEEPVYALLPGDSSVSVEENNDYKFSIQLYYTGNEPVYKEVDDRIDINNILIEIKLNGDLLDEIESGIPDGQEAESFDYTLSDLQQDDSGTLEVIGYYYEDGSQGYEKIARIEGGKETKDINVTEFSIDAVINDFEWTASPQTNFDLDYTVTRNKADADATIKIGAHGDMLGRDSDNPYFFETKTITVGEDNDYSEVYSDYIPSEEVEDNGAPVYFSIYYEEDQSNYRLLADIVTSNDTNE